MRIKHSELDKHDAIAWDFDLTLIDGPNSEFFRKYVLSHPEKKHFIVTFRDKRCSKLIPAELKNHGISIHEFDGVYSCPECYYDCRNDIFEEQFNNWKGNTAKKLGCTLLVDDSYVRCIQGCVANDITFLNSLDKIA